MILADTSVIIAYLRSADAQLLSRLRQHGAVICGITRAEVLFGVRRQQDLIQFTAALDALPAVPIPEKLWDTIGLNLASLRAVGLPMSLADVAIASVAMDLDIELWARDQHFELIRGEFQALKLFQEPP
jgi:predicted nucleic acid-binding protein